MSDQPTLRERIFNGPTLYGPSLASASPAAVEIAALAGCDFVWLEVEHSALDVMQLEHLCRAAELHGILSLARTADPSRPWVLRPLEAGAKIVLVPQVHTVEQAAAVAEWAKFPPLGKRGYNTGSRGLGYGAMAPTPNEILENANRETVLLVQIESQEALDSVEEIAAIEGVDGLFYGPGDMSLDKGIPSDWDNEELLAAGEHIIRIARANGKISSSTCPTMTMAARWKQAGANMLIVGGELALLRKAFTDRLAEVRAL
ncbi:MAG: aldolase/citrate lyase family protein [Acidobacteriota bacterium]|nr:aldolase/citrate lyase family protein [Acidobacteriota bacterium]